MDSKLKAIILLIVAAITAYVIYRYRYFLSYLGKSTSRKQIGTTVEGIRNKIDLDTTIDSGYIGIYQYQSVEAMLNPEQQRNLITGQLEDLNQFGLQYGQLSWNTTAFGKTRDIALGVVFKVTEPTSARVLYTKMATIGWLRSSVVTQTYMGEIQAWNIT